MVMIVEGLPYFAFPEKMKFWIRKVLEIPDSSIRRLGFGLMMAGFVLVFIARR
jgi:uncharacterized protein YjeT (DUF2065 family)